MDNPKEALGQLGVEIPAEVEVKVVAESAEVIYPVLPVNSDELTDKQLEDVAGGDCNNFCFCGYALMIYQFTHKKGRFYMFKRISVILALVISFISLSGVALAGPLNDYTKGQTSLDINWLPDLSMKMDPFTGDGKSGNLDWGVTTGLNGKWAMQYRHFSPETENLRSDPAHDPSGMGRWRFGMKTRELNVLYKIDPNLSAFAGWHQAEFKFWDTSGLEKTTSDRDRLQVGLTGKKQIAPQTSIFAVVGFGKDLTNYETGFAYECAENLELNLFYRYKKVKELPWTYGGTPYKDDVTAKGIGFGLSYKF